jgi:class 3 adenylate cyclase/tetratricopeptide (TPR) repeat protein
LVAICPQCSEENPERAKFCLECGAALAQEPPAPAVEERKVVSVLFCDLVGFTAASEAADPEDVRARLRPYHARLRQEIELYKGTVEKFVGDAVMAVFGAPVAFEDDAERAVRAGLRILEAIEELNEQDPGLELQVRVGVNTGEAVVAVEARPEQGEGIVTGDVVNTASRLQGAAPVNGIAVSEQTYRATERVFDYEELEPVTVKGKAEPLAIWRPLRSRARFGSDVIRTHSTPLVGRELEKTLLIGTFDRAAQQRSCQLVTIVGEPGVGKSRLCAELLAHVENRPGLVRWRQGRCLPYGEGIAFWALGEIVKAQCGILGSDSPEEAATKLEGALPEGDPDRAWLKARLAPLVGAPAEPGSQEESFTAWRRFLEGLAAESETVLVFEDLHWADSALLAFLEHLADWSEGVPLLLLCTARPELYEQHPTFGANARNTQRINLAPLTDKETARLIASLLERAVLPAETQQTLLERAGGNPLYAEEFVRLLTDRGAQAEDQQVPDSVQALIAARLDTLSAERKSLLQDAAVVGKVFWAGALAEMEDRELSDVEQALHDLARKELVRPLRGSSMEGEAEYGFWHVLVRDVCYAQIPRASRAARHQTAAAWMERKAGERVEDLADVLAHHYLTALELVQAAGQTDRADQLEGTAIRYLRLAGERALPLNVTSADASFARALSLAPAGHPERASLLERWAQAAQPEGKLHEAKDALDEAVALYREQGKLLAAGRALTALVTTLWALGDPRRKSVIAEAIALLEAQPPGPELVAAYGELAGVYFVDTVLPEAIATAERALELAAALGLPEPARVLGFRGGARCFRGEPEGLDDIRRAIELSSQEGKSRNVAVLHAILAVAVHLYEGPEAALLESRTGIEFCERRGIAELALAIRASSLSFLVERGMPEQVLSEVDSVASQAEAIGSTISWIDARAVQARLLAYRGEHHCEAANVEQLAVRARESGQSQLIVLAFPVAAQVLLGDGQRQQAQSLLIELEQTHGSRTDPSYGALLPGCVRCALALSNAELAARLVSGVEPSTPIAEHALTTSRAQLAEAAGDHAEAATLYAEAAERWREFGDVPERAYALLGQGRCLVRVGSPAAEVPLDQAQELFAAMGYRPALAETETLLAQTAAAS